MIFLFGISMFAVIYRSMMLLGVMLDCYYPDPSRGTIISPASFGDISWIIRFRLH